MPILDRATFASVYAGQPPWEIGRPQKAFVKVADQISGSILDAGCGSGDNALFFAARGEQVTGIDFLAEPIELARRKALELGLAPRFLVHDALELDRLSETFDVVIDSGLFHAFNNDDRHRYVAGLAQVLRPGGRLFMLCFSEAEPGLHGPRRVSRREIRSAFDSGWKIESITAARWEVRPDLKEMSFSPGGPLAWFAVVQRLANGSSA